MSLTPEYFNFLKELAANHNREWFQTNKNRFEQHVSAPFTALTQNVIYLMQQIDPQINIDYKQAAFRFYRDTRFSADKSPYKLQMSAVVSRMGRQNTHYPEVYYQFGPGDNFIAVGLYRPDKDTLTKIRQAITEHPQAFDEMIQQPDILKYFPNAWQGERNKRLLNKQWQQLAKQQPYLLNKQFYAITHYSPQDLLCPDLPQFIVAHYQSAHAFNEWLLKLQQS
ncbi:MAG TPA: DUF2461 domain-containing protein [Flavobacteriales bacterium]|nr:DUF2461 domain-containing protein [Flavobacteriales bacterium]